MINDSTLIKIVRKTNPYGDWPKEVRKINEELLSIKVDSFKGLNSDCLSYVKFSTIKEDEIFILYRGENRSPLMLLYKSSNSFVIQAVGSGLDLDDPFLLKYKFGEILNLVIEPDTYVYKVDCKPKDTGGPGHFFFYKMPKDSRM